MALPGRKRRTDVPRKKDGKINYDRIPNDYENGAVAKRRELFGEAVSPSAIGRACDADLLDPNPARAERLLSLVRQFALQHRISYPPGGQADSISRLAFGAWSSGNSFNDEVESVLAGKRKQLDRILNQIDLLGRDVSIPFRELALAEHVDTGPSWLDRLLIAKAYSRPKSAADITRLKDALKGVAILAENARTIESWRAL